ncbi:hypothetical protein [Streptosporangium roseum]
MAEVAGEIAMVHGYGWADIETAAEAERAERGAFLQRAYLEG